MFFARIVGMALLYHEDDEVKEFFAVYA